MDRYSYYLNTQEFSLIKLFHIERNKNAEFLLGNISQAEEMNNVCQKWADSQSYNHGLIRRNIFALFSYIFENFSGNVSGLTNPLNQYIAQC